MKKSPGFTRTVNNEDTRVGGSRTEKEEQEQEQEDTKPALTLGILVSLLGFSAS